MHGVTEVHAETAERRTQRACGSPSAPAPMLGAMDPSALLSLQRYAGNAAVGTLIQRCGPGSACACAEEPAEPVAARLEAEAIPAVQRFTDGTVDSPSADLPDGSPYAGMDGDLLAMLGRTLVAKSFWRWNGKAKNLGEALDLLGPDDVNTLVQLCRRLKGAGLFGGIQTISGLWSTSSLGITFSPPGAIDPSALGEKFCKDDSIGQSYHAGKQCWREMVDPGTPGLHVCLPGEVHIDPHQTVSSVLPRAPGIQFGGGSLVSFPTMCVYSLLALVGHMSDVVGGGAVNVFERYSADRGRIADLRERVGKLAQKHDDATATLARLDARLNPVGAVLRRWAIQGLEGGDGTAEVATTLNELTAIERETTTVGADIAGWELDEHPAPMPPPYARPAY